MASVYSILLFVSYPLITQVYLEIFYGHKGLLFLREVTIIFVVLFLIKVFADIFVRSASEKYFTRLEVYLKRLVFKKYKDNLGVLLSQRQSLLSSDVYLYVLLVRTLYSNLIDIIKILFVFLIIFFTRREFLLYFLAVIPFFLLFYLIQHRIMMNNDDFRRKSKDKDFSLLLKRIHDEKLSNKVAGNLVHKFLDDKFKKSLLNKKKEIPVGVSMDSFVSFYRIFFLAYFTSFFIMNNMSLSGLVVGLLFVTLLIKPFLNILKSIPIRFIARKSFFRISSLLK